MKARTTTIPRRRYEFRRAEQKAEVLIRNWLICLDSIGERNTSSKAKCREFKGLVRSEN
jgi:hypothetical protein